MISLVIADLQSVTCYPRRGFKLTSYLGFTIRDFNIKSFLFKSFKYQTPRFFKTNYFEKM